MKTKVNKGELIEFYAQDGAQLHGFLTRGSSKEVVVFLHGMGGNFYRGTPYRLKDSFLSKGYSVFLTNNRGHDFISATQIKPGKREIMGTSYEKFEDSVKDVKAAIDVVTKLGFKKVILAGQSTGCQKALYYMHKSKDRRVKALVLTSPVDDYNHFMEKSGSNFKKLVKLAKKRVEEGVGDKLLREYSGLMSAKRFLSVCDLKNIEARILNYDGPLTELGKVKVPTLMFFGSKDNLLVKTPTDISKVLSKFNNVKVVEVPGVGHGFESKENLVASIAVKWLNSLRKRD